MKLEDRQKIHNKEPERLIKVIIKFTGQHKKIFDKLGVDVIYLFGSCATGQSHEKSDIDVGIVFREPEKYRQNSMKAYSGLYDVFINVLPKSYLQKRVKESAHEFDLVFLQFAPLDMQLNALRGGRVIYQSDPEKEADFRFRALKNYLDLSHLLKIREQAILDRI